MDANGQPLPWIGPLLNAIGVGGGAALQPSPFQQRFPFGTSPSSPVEANYTNLTAQLNKILSGAEQRAASPVSLPDATVQDLPSFFGGGLPMNIGVSAKVGGLANPPSLPGLNLGPNMGGGPPVLNPTNPGQNPGDSGFPGGAGQGNDTGGTGGGTSGGGGGGGRHQVSMPVRQNFTDLLDPNGDVSGSSDAGTGTGPTSMLSGGGSRKSASSSTDALSLLKMIASGQTG
jgi:hypothetical protein